jgi:hypothetical protein
MGERPDKPSATARKETINDLKINRTRKPFQLLIEQYCYARYWDSVLISLL